MTESTPTKIDPRTDTDCTIYEELLILWNRVTAYPVETLNRNERKKCLEALEALRKVIETGTAMPNLALAMEGLSDA